MRVVASIDEFKDVLFSWAELPESERIPLLSNCFLLSPEIRGVPDDPFSPDYAGAVMDIYRTISKRDEYKPTEHEKCPFDMDEYERRPPIYQGDGQSLSRYLITFGQMMALMNARPGMRVIEYGPGDGQFSLMLARLGCDVTVVDIEPSYLELIRRQAERLRVNINTVEGTFMTKPGEFDCVVYFEAFHHCPEHQELLESLRSVCVDGGLIVFGGEPIIDPNHYWKNAVPYPWGPRLDGLSLRAMIVHGWMELGFQEPYFAEALARTGWSLEKHPAPAGGFTDTFIARKN